MSHKDKLYKKPIAKILPFSFNQDTATAFDDMAKRSIPFYQELQVFVAKLVKHYYQPKTMIYDLGCSTGNTILAIDRVMDQPYQLTAVDKSPEMIELAKQKIAGLSNITLHAQGIEEIAYHHGSIINAAYVLQFVNPDSREAVISNIYNGLEKGGVLILSEKTCFEDHALNDMMIEHYHQFKFEQGYSRLEIKQKEEALKNILIPFTATKYERLLQEQGFSYCHPVFKYMNFITWVAMK